MVKPANLLVAQEVVLDALFSHLELARLFVLKGAHATRLLGGTARATRDLDLTSGSDLTFSRGDEQRSWLQRLLREALDDFFEEHHAGRWSVYAVSVQASPAKKPHIFGWDSYSSKLTLVYRAKAQHVVEIDVSFGDATTGIVHIESESGLAKIPCYSREQIVAEKLRAFLQKLAPHRRKVGAGGVAVPRVRDLGDIYGLLRADGSHLDLNRVAQSLREKCRAKFVDLNSPADFAPHDRSIDEYRTLFKDAADFPNTNFDDVWKEVMLLVERLKEAHGLPGLSPLPE